VCGGGFGVPGRVLCVGVLGARRVLCVGEPYVWRVL
jgi:hypothetical protein